MLLKEWCFGEIFSNNYIVCRFFPKKKIIFCLINTPTTLVNKYVCEHFSFSFMEKLLISKLYDKTFPTNYNFELKKTIFRINNVNKRKIIIQIPDGIADFTSNLVSFLSNQSIEFKNFSVSSRTSFGACCLEDFMGKLIGFCMILHYSHSCLIPVSECRISVLYIFLEIGFDVGKITETIRNNFFFKTKIFFFGTVQFIFILQQIRKKLNFLFESISIVQGKPLSPGEILGCTCSKLATPSNVLFIGDGRFHIEAITITNPSSFFFQFNPFLHKFLAVSYNYWHIFREKGKSILKSIRSRENVSIITGILGRQGNHQILRKIKELLKSKKYQALTLSTSEISHEAVKRIGNKATDVFGQIACPRLSYDWGKYFSKPILNPYELCILFCSVKWNISIYPLDFYNYEGGFWSNYSSIKSVYTKVENIP